MIPHHEAPFQVLDTFPVMRPELKPSLPLCLPHLNVGWEGEAGLPPNEKVLQPFGPIMEDRPHDDVKKTERGEAPRHRSFRKKLY